MDTCDGFLFYDHHILYQVWSYNEAEPDFFKTLSLTWCFIRLKYVALHYVYVSKICASICKLYGWELKSILPELKEMFLI